MSTAIVYRTAPMAEHKAADELRRAGIRAYVPRDRGSRRNPFTGKHTAPAPGYVFAGAALSSAYAKHCKAPIGNVPKIELHRLYLRRPRQQATACPYRPGDTVSVIKGRMAEITSTVIEVRGRLCIIATKMLGKEHRQSIHYTQLRPG